MLIFVRCVYSAVGVSKCRWLKLEFVRIAVYNITSISHLFRLTLYYYYTATTIAANATDILVIYIQ